MPSDLSQNPLLADWHAPFGLPPFAAIRPEHYLPALREGIKQAQAEIDAIANNPDAPTFENTILALEKSGTLLGRVSSIFYMLTNNDTNKVIQATEVEIGPELTENGTKMMLNAPLFKRVDAVYEQREILPAQAKRLVERYHRDFIESGAKLDAQLKERVSTINIRLSELMTQFGQNKLAEQNDYELVLGPDDLEGLPQSTIDSAAASAAERGKPGQHVITLNGPNRGAFMTYSPRRELRESLYIAGKNRADRDNENDNKAIIIEIVKLRDEYAQIMGYKTYARYKMADRMAKNPANAHRLLDEIWTNSKPAYLAEKQELETLAAELGLNGAIEEWDWAYYANLLRKRELDFDAEEAKQYLTFDAMVAAAFDTATKLFGITFREAKDLALYHPDVRAWEVLGKDGKHRALYLADPFTRPSKRSGAWMSSLRGRNLFVPKLQQTPIVYNAFNYNKPAPGEPCLLTVNGMETVFHEFGHALHEMLSITDYPSLSGTSVKHDFVELPSQVYEHWAVTDEVLGTYATHHKTGEPMPQTLREKIRASLSFRQGHFISGFVASIKLDMGWHEHKGPIADVHEFEKALNTKYDVPEGLDYFYPSTSFGHIFDNDHYAVGYYSYLWAQVLDADAFEAFVETGDVFNREVAQKLHDYVYSAGDSDDPAELYRKFRGRDAGTEPLLRNFGFLNDNSRTGTPAQAQTKAAT